MIAKIQNDKNQINCINYWFYVAGIIILMACIGAREETEWIELMPAAIK